MKKNNYFFRVSLPRTAILVGWIHILVPSFELTRSVYGIIEHYDDNDPFYDAKRDSFVVDLCIFLTFGIAGALLVIGTYTKSPWMFVPWLIIEALCLIGAFTSASTYVISMFFGGWNDVKIFEFALYMVYFSFIALCVYVWFGILQFYHILRDEKRQNQIQSDEEKLVAASIRGPGEKAYLPTYFIPIDYSIPKQPPSLIKY